MTSTTVHSWSELQDALFADTFNPRIDRYKARYAFRGVSDASYPLTTSLMRLGGTYTKVEIPLLRQFRKYAHEHRPSENSDWYWLSVAQHYGLPTRLLDWTYSPQIALHFATCNTARFDRDGAIYRVNYKKVHQQLPALIRAHIEEENTWILTVDLLERAIAKGLEELDRVGRERGDYAIFFEPPSLDARITNQYAYFSVLSRSDLSMSEWLASRPEVWNKIVIPASLKWEVRDKLDQSNINERVLFPGLAGLSEWLRRYYLPTGSAAD